MSKRLLVTDDALIIREMIKEVATENGWEIAGEATNGADAIEQFDDVRPDVTTLDMVMPGTDGLHALEGIRKLDPEAKVLVVSALEQREVLKDAMKMGAADFIVKPFDRKRLAETLDKLLSA
jgi:two-component system, chemotaxis family, chemotaxis protein CheY